MNPRVGIFLVPWAFSLLVLIILPLTATFGLTLFDWDFLTPPQWAGSQNFRNLILDPMVGKALRVTCLFALLSAFSEVLGGLWLGLLMHQKVPAIGAFRTLCYLPTVLSGVASTLIGMWLFQPNAGLVNQVLARMGIQGPRWLLEPGWALLALWIMTFWGLGRSALLVLAARQAIPQQYFEAALMDGANAWQTFRAITLPYLMPTLAFNLLVGVANAMHSFANAYVATAGGPLESTTLYVLYLYQVAFQQLRLGYAATLVLVLFGVSLALSWMMEKLNPEETA